MKDKTNKSLCEKSMKMLVNIVKLSSLSIAKMSLGTAAHLAAAKNLPPVTGSDVAADEPLLSQFPGSRKSEKPQGSARPISFLMEPGGENESFSHVIPEEESAIDDMASDYIRKVHEKNQNDLQKTSKLSPFILPPPRVLK